MSYKTLAPSYMSRVRAVMSNVGSGQLVLNVGCGDGFYDQLLCKKFSHVVGFDINLRDVQHAQNAKEQRKIDNVSYVFGDGMGLAFKDCSFDTIVCVDVLEHVKNDDALITEMNRVLRNGGSMIVTVPHANFPFPYDPINYVLKFFNAHIPIGLWGLGTRGSMTWPV